MEYASPTPDLFEGIGSRDVEAGKSEIKCPADAMSVRSLLVLFQGVKGEELSESPLEGQQSCI